MRRTRHTRVSVRRRALDLITAHPDGCTEAILAAEGIPADVLIELVQSGLAIARNERVGDEDGVIEVTRLWITGAGTGVLAARGSCRLPKRKSPAEAGIGTRTSSEGWFYDAVQCVVGEQQCCPG